MSVMLEDEDELQVTPLSVDDRLKLVDRDAATAALDAAMNGSFGALRDAGVVLADIGNGTLKISGMTY